ncbi:hypothetical protein SAMN05216553_109135 [Lentzea fradiae]|uniref:Uncharacterized protein n=1 Tax=Lentzea fradiae TaxID=200378 RepID=A0A1G7VCS5_9PSEU|nr:hypothetical protein [Lentzea fradiae]SDG57149.1 hypothetical protein SAMN05216553_109135 [Lentzea fradiae]
MAIPAEDLRKLLQSGEDASLVHIAGKYVVASRDELESDELRGALTVVNREDLLERLGGRPVTDRELEEAAATLSAAVDNRGG